MTEYIERKIALSIREPSKSDRYYQTYNLDDAYGQGWDDALCCIESIPIADVAPIIHGQWETNSDRPDTLICSVCKCGFDMWKHDPHNFCPNCGAIMDEVIK